MSRTRSSLTLASAGLLTTSMLITAHAGAKPADDRASAVGTTVQMSVWTGGFKPGLGANNADANEERRQVSADGRYVAMAVSGPVVPGQRQLSWQIVRRDRALGTTELISKSSSGDIGDGWSSSPSISADGQVVAFTSEATNLVAGDTNGQRDVFVHDVRNGTTIRASADAAGNQVHDPAVSGTYISQASISADGNWVGFVGKERYTPDSSDKIQAYLRHIPSGAIEVVSRTSTGAPDLAHVGTAVSPSSDGSLVAYVDPSPAGGLDIKVVDRRTTPASVRTIPTGKHADPHHTLSADGGHVVFDSDAADLVPGDTNAASDVFVHHLGTGTTRRVSVGSGGVQADAGSWRGAISADGRYVSFTSDAANLAVGDTNGLADIFRHDTTTGDTVRVSVAADGSQNPQASGVSGISGDGQHVTFASHGSNLTQVDTQGYGQVFVRDLNGRYPALFARTRALPARIVRRSTHRVGTLDIRTSPLEVIWTRGSRVIRQRATVSGNAFVLRAPKQVGKYTVSVRYGGHEVRTRKVTVIRPSATVVRQVRKSKSLKVKTTGLNRGQRIQVRFAPLRGTGGKAVNRTRKVNAKGVAKVKAPARAGRYRVIIRANKQVLRKATIRVR